jgi:CBS domain-containing protein
LTVGQLYEPITPVPDWLVVDEFVLRHVLPNRQTYFLLVGFDGRPSGYVSIKDLSKVGPDERLVQPVRRYARSLGDVPVLAPGEPAKRIMNARQAVVSPVLALVVDHGEPIGIVTRSGMADAIERARLVVPSRQHNA